MKKRCHITALLVILGMLAVLTAGAGCKTGAHHAAGNTLTGRAMEGEPEPDLHVESRGTGDGLHPVYFDYDSAAFRREALATLADNARKIQSVPLSVRVQIEGHCDERGTQEYNLALGDKRAQTVREHLIRLGVSRDRLTAVSFGEERPAVSGHDEQAWAKNRRVDFSRAP
jgi:peptidoglycan-associated lipoprotein